MLVTLCQPKNCL